MARIPKFVIRMADDYPANTLDGLKEHFDINTIVECFHDRRLLRWLKARHLTDLAEQVEKLSADDKSLAKKLCAIFGIVIDDDYSESSPDQIIFEIMRRVKQHTADDNLIKQIKEELETGIANVAFEQNDLDDLVEDYDKIYLCSRQFVIPLNMKNKKYVGVGDKAVANIKSSEPVDFDALHISFEKIPFDDDYRKIIKPPESPEEKAKKIYEEAEYAFYAENDYETAIEKYKQAANLGYLEAFTTIGTIYLLGDEVEKDINEARRWYKLGMEKDDGDSFGSYALSLKTGYESESDKREAFNCMKRATELNSEYGGWWYHLGDMYYDGTGTSKNFGEAFRCYEKGTEAGDSYATNMLGIMYTNGEYVTKDEYKAFALFKKAVELNDKNIVAVRNLADCYRYGDGVAQDYYKAFELYKQAAEVGDVEAMATVANMLVAGKGVQKDKDKAFYWLKKSVDAGNDDIQAIRNLAIAYHHGTGTFPDSAKALDLYHQAADAGDINALIRLGEMFRNGDGVDQNFQQALSYFQQAADKGNGEAMNYIAWIYNGGGYGVTRDEKLAFQWYKKAAEAGDANGMSNLSLCYLWKIGVPKNINNAMYWMRKAAENGAYYGMLQYANWLYSQDPTDYRLIEMYEQAAKAGYGEAAYKLSLMYRQGCRAEKGSSVTINTAWANYWERKYKELGYAPD